MDCLPAVQLFWVWICPVVVKAAGANIMSLRLQAIIKGFKRSRKAPPHLQLTPPQGLCRGRGWGGGVAWASPTLGNLVHTYIDFLYKRTYSRRWNAHKNMTFSTFLMHFEQNFKGLKFQKFSGGAWPRTPQFMTACTFEFSPPLQNKLHGPCTSHWPLWLHPCPPGEIQLLHHIALALDVCHSWGCWEPIHP